MRPSQRAPLVMRVGMLVLLGILVSAGLAQTLGYQESVIAGGPDTFAEVRHVVLKGSNYEIGKKIGELAKREGAQVKPSGDKILNRAKREYMAHDYPIHYQRMRGLASSYGLNISNDSYDFTALFQPQVPFPGCSVVFFPAEHTENGHDILSKNYDFPTGDIRTGRRLEKGKLAVMSRPYLFEIHPDQGYSSLSLCAFDYLGGVLDGINAKGLVVSILSVGESAERAGYEPGREVGMHELMSMRYLLDTCQNVEEAKTALLSLKHYYCLVPCHYIVADKTGKSFIFEFSHGRNRSYIIDGKGPQCITNHLVFQHAQTAEKQKDNPSSSLRRYNTLEESIRAKKTFTLEEIAAINAKVAVPPEAPSNPEMALNRTLWYAQYDLDNVALTVKFYLGEKPDTEDNKRVILEYTPPRVYRLSR